MVRAELIYNPYLLETDIEYDGIIKSKRFFSLSIRKKAWALKYMNSFCLAIDEKIYYRVVLRIIHRLHKDREK